MTKDEARDKLRSMLPKGSTVYTVLRHVSRSGMQRAISPVLCQDGSVHDISYLVAPAIGERFDRKHDGIIMHGAGMDMGFALVYALSMALFCPDKYDHDAAYSLKHRWL